MKGQKPNETAHLLAPLKGKAMVGAKKFRNCAMEGDPKEETTAENLLNHPESCFLNQRAQITAFGTFFIASFGKEENRVDLSVPN